MSDWSPGTVHSYTITQRKKRVSVEYRVLGKGGGGEEGAKSARILGEFRKRPSNLCYFVYCVGAEMSLR